MSSRIAVSLLAITASAVLRAQRAPDATKSGESTWLERTPWGDPDLGGEWTSEGEYGVPFERPLPCGTRRFLTDEEYAKRLDDVRVRDERDLAPVDVFSGKVDGPSAPIPHWRDGLGVPCIVHGGGFPDAMFPVVYNANMRIVQSAGVVERFTRTGRDAIRYEVTFVDPATWTTPWTAALDLEARPADAGVFEYACHEGNVGMASMLSAARFLERSAADRPANESSQQER
jgi:hypothetical protein